MNERFNLGIGPTPELPKTKIDRNTIKSPLPSVRPNETNMLINLVSHNNIEVPTAQYQPIE